MQTQPSGGFITSPVGYRSNGYNKEGLWQQIWDTFLLYLESEDSPFKLKQKCRLTDLMRLMLSHVPHTRKFYLRSTSTVLQRSVDAGGISGGVNEEFSPLCAVAAFETLHEYAVRAITQPWRPEYTSIHLYGGHYVHTVASCLVDAELLLADMGYKVDGDDRAGAGVARMTATRVGADQLTRVAIDTLLASVECRMMHDIMVALPAALLAAGGGAAVAVGVGIVARHRRTYTASVDEAVRDLCMTASRQRVHQLHADSGTTDLLDPRHRCETDGGVCACASLVQTGRLVDVTEPAMTSSSSCSSLATAATSIPAADNHYCTTLLPTTVQELNLAEFRPPRSHITPRHEQQTPAVTSSTSWACHACTFINTAGASICCVCGKTRQQCVEPVCKPAEHSSDQHHQQQEQDEGEEKEEDGQQVSCGVCTLLNSRRARRCGACNSWLVRT